MKYFTVFRIFLLSLLFTGLNYGQKKEVFKSTFWLKNFVKQDTLNENKLNSYLPLLLDSNINWISKDKIKNNNTIFIVYKSNEDSENFVSIVGKNKALFFNTQSIKMPTELDIKGYNENYGEILDVNFGFLKDGILNINTNSTESFIYEIILENNLSNDQINEIRTYLSIKYGIDLIDSKQYRYRNKDRLWKDCANERNIFGIGKFIYFDLLQKESIHSKNKDIKSVHLNQKEMELLSI